MRLYLVGGLNPSEKYEFVSWDYDIPNIYEFWRDPTPFTRTCASRMAHRLRQTSTIFRQVEIHWHTDGQSGLILKQTTQLYFWFLPHSFQPLHKSLGSLPKKPRLAQNQQHKQQQQQQQTKQQTIAKPFQNLSGLGFDWLQFYNEVVRTRSEIKFWETDLLSLLTNSLVATRFRVRFRTVKLKSFQRWSRRRQKRRQRASKGDRGETKGHKRGKQGGGDKFERAQTV